jgi:hypothetical protein
MNMREIIIALPILVFVVLAVTVVRGRSSASQRRLDALLDALHDPQIDATTRTELLRALVHDHVGFTGRMRARLQQPGVGTAIWFGLGWFLFVLSGACLVLHVTWIAPMQDSVPMLAMLAATGFAMVSMPMAWREVTRRLPADPGS